MGAVVLYTAVIVYMANQAMGMWWHATPQMRFVAKRVATGSLFFLVSDSILAIVTFAYKVPHAPLFSWQ